MTYSEDLYGFKFKDVVFKPNVELSTLERNIFRDFERRLEAKGYNYLSIPSTITHKTLERQEVVSLSQAWDLGDGTCLSGSAEQGILEYFADQDLSKMFQPGPLKLYAINQCWRREDSFEPLIRCKEFKKIEQFVFTDNENEARDQIFNEVFCNATKFLDDYYIEWRLVDVTSRDSGYHVKKYDIEIKTKRRGWVETHSCTYFGDEQTKRFGITGKPYTVSNTGIASPRILLPFIEDELANYPEQE